MKAIKISRENGAKINTILGEVNGSARSHCFSDEYDIRYVVGSCEADLIELLPSKKMAIGAKVIAVSGDEVSNAYSKKGRTRAATRITAERRATGWFLTSVERAEIYQDGGFVQLILTEDQDCAAVSKFRSKNYLIAK